VCDAELGDMDGELGTPAAAEVDPDRPRILATATKLNAQYLRASVATLIVVFEGVEAVPAASSALSGESRLVRPLMPHMSGVDNLESCPLLELPCAPLPLPLPPLELERNGRFLKKAINAFTNCCVCTSMDADTDTLPWLPCPDPEICCGGCGCLRSAINSARSFHSMTPKCPATSIMVPFGGLCSSAFSSGYTRPRNITGGNASRQRRRA